MLTMNWLRRLWIGMKSAFLGRGRPLCDDCKYDYGDACSRPERPNAYSCPDYRRR